MPLDAPRSCSFAAVMLFAASPLLALAADPLDWPHWRGPEQSGISRETGLIDRFNPRGGAGSNVLWKSEAAAGISTPIVMGGKLYTIVRDQPDTPREGEKVICLDANTSETLWETRYNVFLSDVPAERVGWSNCAGDPSTGRVFVLGSSSLLLCLDGETGRTIWTRSLSEEFGMLSTYGGRTNTPVVFEGLVVVSGVTTGWDETARPAHRFFGFNKENGLLHWISGTRPLPEDTTYSTPFATVIDGQAVCVAGSGDGTVFAFQPRTGKKLWSYPLSRRGVNVSPVVVNGRVFVSHAEENPSGTSIGTLAAIDGMRTGEISKSGEIWSVQGVTAGRSSPLLVDGRLYTVDDAAGLRVFDAESGQPMGRPLKLGTAMRGSLLWADGKIYACTSAGNFHVLQPTEAGVKSIFRTRLPAGEECGGSPIVSHGKIYLPTTGGLYCLGIAGQPPSATPIPAAPAEASVASGTSGQLQLVPAEAIVQPGQTLEFEVHAYDDQGRWVRRVTEGIEFSTTQGEASVDPQGVLLASAAAQHSAVTVTATAGELTARARVRIVPALPWNFDFGDRQVPVTWIGARHRHEVRDVDGQPMMVKLTTTPKGTRSQAWMGPADLHDYTVQADLQAGATGKLPDMGVIAQRYTLDMQGELQQLQIRTWPPQLRMAKSVPFAWEAGVWYTVKLQATTVGERVVLHGKVWKRGEPEPEAWTLTAEDQSPNLSGSPGLFGNATNAEIFVDNVAVYGNSGP